MGVVVKIRTLIGGAALVAMALACGGGEVEDISIDVPAAVDAPEASGSSAEKSDVEALCVAITESGETDAETDAALADAKVTTDKGKALAVSLQEGDVLPDAPMDELIDWIRATGAQESSLDCALIEGLWSLGE
jgi:hypothetical protein